MAKINFGGVEENVVTREEFPLEKAREVLKNETIAVIGYGVQGPGQSLNLRDNGLNVIVGQREGSKSWEKAVADGWEPGKTLFGIEEAAERATIIQYLLSDAGSDRRMAHHRKTPHAGQGALLLARLRHHLQGTHGYRAPGRRGRDPDRPQRLGHLAAAHVPRRAGDSIRAMRSSRTPRAAPSNAWWRWASA